MKNLQIPNRRDIANRLGTSNAYLWQIETGRRRPSRWLAEAIVRETGGAVSMRDLRPDLYPPEQAGIPQCEAA